MDAMNETLLTYYPEKREQKHQHYKGTLYYLLTEAIILDNNRANHGTGNREEFEIIGECYYEPTKELMWVFKSINPYPFGGGKKIEVAVAFQDRESTPQEYMEPMMIYRSIGTGDVWARAKRQWEEPVHDGIKRFTRIPVS